MSRWFGWLFSFGVVLGCVNFAAAEEPSVEGAFLSNVRQLTSKHVNQHETCGHAMPTLCDATQAQKRMLEMSASWPLGVSRPELSKEPAAAVGEYVTTFRSVEPFRTTAEMSTVELHVPPVAVPVTVTLPWLPARVSKT